MEQDPIGDVYGELNKANEEICQLMDENKKLKKENETLKEKLKYAEGLIPPRVRVIDVEDDK